MSQYGLTLAFPLLMTSDVYLNSHLEEANGSREMTDHEEFLCGGCRDTFDDLDERKQHRLEAHPAECRPIRFCFCAFCGKQQHSDFRAYDHLVEVHPAQWNEMVSRMLMVSRLKEHHFQERWALAGSACFDTRRRATLKSVLKSIDDFWTYPSDKENNQPPSTSRDQANSVEELHDECTANANDSEVVHATSSTVLIDECNNKKKDHQSPVIQKTASPLIEPSSSEISDEEEQVPSTSSDQPREEPEPVQYASVITRTDNTVDTPARKRVAFDVPSSQGPSTSVLEGILKKPRTEPPATSSPPQQVIQGHHTADGVTMPVLIPKEMIRFHDNGLPYIDMSVYRSAGPKKYAFLPEESLRKEPRLEETSAQQQQQASFHASTLEPGPSQQTNGANVGKSDSPSSSSGSASRGNFSLPYSYPVASRSSSTNAPTLQSLLDAPLETSPLEDVPMSSSSISWHPSLPGGVSVQPTAPIPTRPPQAVASPVEEVSQVDRAMDPDYVFYTGRDTTGQCPRCPFLTRRSKQTKRGHFQKCHYDIYYAKVGRAETELQTFLFISLGHELPNRPRKCLHCTLSRANHMDRKALLEHHVVSHPAEFHSFRNRFEQLQKECGGVVDKAILELIQKSYLIQS